MVDKINARAHDLAPLEVSDRVRVQNQAGNAKTRWSRTGTVVEINNEFDQYLVMMDGSRCTTARNRKFLRKIRADGPATGCHNGGTAVPTKPVAFGPTGRRSEPAIEAGTPPRGETRATDRATLRPEANTPARSTHQTIPRWATGNRSHREHPARRYRRCHQRVGGRLA